MDLVSDFFDAKNVDELERLSTALYVLEEGSDSTEAFRAARIQELKPHVSLSNAVDAVRALDRFLERSGVAVTVAR